MIRTILLQNSITLNTTIKFYLVTNEIRTMNAANETQKYKIQALIRLKIVFNGPVISKCIIKVTVIKLKFRKKKKGFKKLHICFGYYWFRFVLYNMYD